MSTIVTRSGKGSPLTHAEVDNNFTNLNTDKLETAGGTMTGNLSFGDNDKAIFGAGSDLQIYHNGSHSYISDQGSGNLYLQASGQLRLQSSTGENYLLGNADGAVNLYYDNAQKFTTTATGVDITGVLSSDGLTVEGTTGVTISGAYPTIFFGETDTTDLNTRLRTSGGSLNISTVNDAYTGGINRFNIDHSTGDISFYEDTGTTAKFFWDASAESLGIGTSSPANPISISGTAFNPAYGGSVSGGIDLQGATAGNGNYTSGIAFRMGTRQSSAIITGVQDTTDEDRVGLAFFTNPDGSGATAAEEAMRITSDGSVGIGTSSPSVNLQVENSSGAATLAITSQSANATGSSLWLGDTADEDVGYINYSQYTNSMQIGTNGSERMRIDSSGNVDIGSTGGGVKLAIAGAVGPQNGTAAAPTHTFYGDNDTGMFRAAVNTLGFSTGAAEAMRIDSSGNVGIGTSSPSGILQLQASNPDMYITSANTGQSDIYFGGTTNPTKGRIQYSDNSDLMAFWTNSLERMRIDSSGNVGIGIVPNATGGGFKALQLGLMTNWAFPTTGSAYRSHNLYYDGTNRKYVTTGTAHEYEQSSAGHVFSTAASGTAGTNVTLSEAMRLDSSGNLLVGTTDVDLGYTDGDTGFAIDGANGFFGVARSPSASTQALAYLNRLDSDGEIVQFRKDGATVGSIGVSGSRLQIGTSSASAIYFDSNNNSVNPSDLDGSSDNVLDLGKSSGRWKDLYLSGGVYLGGTGSANYLDDYEEGTWTPTLKGGTSAGSASYTARYGYYTRIGNIVQISMTIACSSVTGTGDMVIDGLPFTTGSGSIDSVFSFQWNACSWSGPSAEKQTVIPMLYQTNNTTIGFRASDYRSTYAHAQVQLLGSGDITYARITGTYRLGTT